MAIDRDSVAHVTSAFLLYAAILGLLVLSIHFPDIISAYVVYLMLIVTVYILRRRERRIIDWGGGALQGVVLGAALITAVFVFDLLTGLVHVTAIKNHETAHILAGTILLGVLVAAGEELSFREYILRNFATGMGTNRAILLSALMFSMIHLPSMMLMDMATANGMIMCVTLLLNGILLAILYLNRGLVAATGFHFAWNFLQYNVYALRSGFAGPLELIYHGPVLFTGGEYGPEAGLIGVIVMGIGIMIATVRHRGTGTGTGTTPGVAMMSALHRIRTYRFGPKLFLKATVPLILVLSLICMFLPRSIADDYTIRLMQLSLLFGFICSVRAARTHTRELRKTFLFLSLFIFFMFLSNIDLFWHGLIAIFGKSPYLGLVVAVIAYIMLMISCTYVLKITRVKELSGFEWAILGAMFIIYNLIVVYPLLTSAQHSIDLMVSVIFRLLDVGITLMLLPVIFLYRRQSELEAKESITFTIIVIGIIMSTIGDWLLELFSGISHQEIAAMFHTGSLVDSIYLFSYLLIALGLYVHINYGTWSVRNIETGFKLRIKEA